MMNALMIPIFGFLAFTVDTGYICYTKGQLENAADAAALAASLEFGSGSTYSLVRRPRPITSFELRHAAQSAVIRNCRCSLLP